MESVESIDHQMEELQLDLRRELSRIGRGPFWETRQAREECERIEASLRYLQAQRKAALEGRELPTNPGHILCERECEKCGAPLGRGVWVEKVEPGTMPKLSPRNHTDEEIGEAFWEKHPYLIGAVLSKKVWGVCSDCREY